jgi:hypothetical protein
MVERGLTPQRVTLTTLHQKPSKIQEMKKIQDRRDFTSWDIHMQPHPAGLPILIFPFSASTFFHNPFLIP